MCVLAWIMYRGGRTRAQMQSSSVSSWEKRENYHSPMVLGNILTNMYPKSGVLMFFFGATVLYGSSFCEQYNTELDNCWIPQCLIQLREWTMRACARECVAWRLFFSEKSKTEYRLEISFSHTYIAIIYIHYLWKSRQLAVRGLFPTNILLSSLIVSSSHMQLLPSMKKNHHLIGANLEDGRRKRRRVSSGWSE